MQITQPQIADANPYAWPHDSSLPHSALIVIDMQKDFCEQGGYLTHQGYSIAPMRSIIPNIESLLTSFRSANLPIIHTREGHVPDLSDLSPREAFRSRNNASGKGIGDEGPMGRILIRGEVGHDTIPELYPRKGDIVIDKPGKGAFTGTNLDGILRVKGIRNLVLCGDTTDVCVHTTMREANDRGYDCLLVEDCCAAGEERLHDAAVEMVRGEGGVFGCTAALRDVQETLERLKSS